MRTLEQARKYEVLMGDGTWQPVHWEQLDEGDIVRAVHREGVRDPYLDIGPNPFKISEQPHLKTDDADKWPTRDK